MPFIFHTMQYSTDRTNFLDLTTFTWIFSLVFYFHEIKTANVIYILLHYWQTENVRRKISHLPLGADQLGGHPYTQSSGTVELTRTNVKFIPRWSWVRIILIIEWEYRERLKEYVESFLRDYREFFERLQRVFERLQRVF